MDRVEFTHLVFLLMNYANRIGLNIAGDWWLRDQETQKRLYAEKKSRTLNSRHGVGKAIDFIIFDDQRPRQPQWKHNGYKLLGEYWKSLNEDCVWGGDWLDEEGNPRDPYHFEVK